MPMGDLALCNKDIAATLQQACFYTATSLLSAAESSAFSGQSPSFCKVKGLLSQILNVK